MSGKSAADDWRVGSVFDGRYRVVSELGRGGMGVVHRVRHLAWDIDMAVKSTLEEVFRSPVGQGLFVREAEAWVSLGLHPHICACYYVRVMDGVPRVFAEYVAGGSLRDWIRDGRLYAGGGEAALARVLDVAVQVARGLEHAHSRGLVHLDVKPANVLLDESGNAKITDFGLARSKAAVAAAPGTASSGSDVSVLVPNGGMTLAYASPEQLAGKRLGRRSDVYSFAVSVLELLTGEVRWEAGSVAGAGLGYYLSDPDNPVAAPPRLAELLGRCLRPDPAARPSSMAEIAAELAELYEQATGLPYPRPASPEAALRADELSNRGLSLLDLGRADEAEAAFAEALTVDPHHLGAVYNAGLLRWRSGVITDVELVAQLSEVARHDDSAWSASHLLAQVHLERGDYEAVRALLDVLARQPPGPGDDLANQIRDALRSGRVVDARCVGTKTVTGIEEIPGPPIELLARHEVTGYQAQRFSADGRLTLTGHWDGTVRLWDVAADRLLRTLEGHRGQVMNIDFDAAARHALSTGYDGTVRFWDLGTGRCLAVFPAGRDTRFSPVRLSADGRVGVWVGESGRIEVWDLRSGALQRVLGFPLKDSSIEDSTFQVNADGSVVLTAEDSGARVWSPADGRSLALTTAAPSKPTDLCLSPDGRFAAVATADRAIRLWDLADGRCVRTLTGHTAAAGTLALSSDLRYLLSGSVGDETVRYWELETGRCLRTFTDHDSYGTVWVALPAGDARIGLSAENHRPLPQPVYTWRLPAGYTAEPFLIRPRRYAEVSRLAGEVEALLAAADRELADARPLAAFDLLTRARAVPGYERAPRILAAWRRLGRSATRTGLRGAWSRKLADGQAALGDVVSIGLSADARLAVTAHYKSVVRVWDLDSRARTRVLEDDRGWPTVVALSGDGGRAQCHSLGSISSWELESGERGVIPVGREMTRTVRFIADGRQALFGGGDGVIRRWDLEANRCLSAMPAPSVGTNEIALCADERLAAVGDSTGAVRLWDLEQGTILRSWKGHGEPVLSVSLSRDGRRALSTAMDDPVIRLWDASSETCVREFAGHGEGWISTVRFTPDGRFAFSAGHDMTLRLWEVESGRCVHVLKGHEGAVRHVELSGDLRHLLSAGDDGLRLWDLDWDLSVGHVDHDG